MMKVHYNKQKICNTTYCMVNAYSMCLLKANKIEGSNIYIQAFLPATLNFIMLEPLTVW